MTTAMTTVRAKFNVYSIKKFSYSDTTVVELQPVYSTDPEHENKKFWDATPSGKIEMSIKSDVAALFELGKEYYVTFEMASQD